MYESTRGGVSGRSFEEALFTGYASDGGLLLPHTIPKVTRSTLSEWAEKGFTELAKQIIPLFIPEHEIPQKDLEGLLDKAFSCFSVPEIAPVRRLKDGLNILELFHGPTWAFKDLALCVVGQLYNYFCSKSKTHYTVLVGTSGDTGSAAIEAVRGLKWVDIIVLLPKGRTSHIQELQMTTVIEDNVHVYRVDGTSDDLDAPIKRCFLDDEFVKQHHLTSINSINWARIMVQIVHYFYAYFNMCPSCDRDVEIVIPTGACGNVTAGCIARQMGLPVRMVCAVTQNDIVARTILHGDFSISSEVKPTLARAMDIQMPYNMERLWYLFSGGEAGLVLRLMEEFENTGAVSVPENLSAKISEVIVDSVVVTDEEVKSTMRRTWADNSYRVCPHTATAATYSYSANARENPESPMLRICLATASIAKFQEAAIAAGLPPQENQTVTDLEEMPTRYVDLYKDDDWEGVLRWKIIDIDNSRS